MENRPLISILMGIYNCAETLEEAVKCIINQSYENWELIMCDDCSTDNTYKTAQSLAEKDSRIVLLRNEKNMTLAPTLNKCLEFAKGEYVARMDGDDCCDEYRLQKELEFLETHVEYSLVSCQMLLFDEQGIYRTIDYKREPEKKDFPKKSQFCHAGCMMRTSVMRELHGYDVAISRNRVEDYDLWIRLYHAGYKGYNLQEPLYSMRDDRYAQRRRNWLNRVNESKVKYQACKLFELPLRYYVYVLVPIIKWMLPSFVYNWIHRKH